MNFRRALMEKSIRIGSMGNGACGRAWKKGQTQLRMQIATQVFFQIYHPVREKLEEGLYED